MKMYELRDYQQKAHNATLAHMRDTFKSDKFDPAYVSASVGAGKTLLIAFLTQQIMSRPGNSVLVLARQGELVEQNSLDAREIGVKLSIFSASLNQKSTYYPVIFGTEGTVSRSLDREFKDRAFTAILVDECHMMDWQDCLLTEPETQYGKIIKHFNDVAKAQGKKPPLIIGYTGSPYRGSDSIYGPFWKKQLTDISTYELINKGFLVPPVFGFGDEDHHYESLDKFKIKGGEGAEDFSSKELAAMGRAICKEQTKTQEIIQEVIERTKNRMGVMITCASKKHCEQVAECLPEGSWGIVTDSTPTKERRRILSDIKTNKIKYIIQIGCLTTGFNANTLDTSVILRKIGSLTLLIQLIGRVLRTLKPEHIEAGLVKKDALVLDYSDSIEAIGDLYDDPIVQQAMEQKGKAPAGEQQECPLCATLNSEYAVRCVGQSENSDDGRCEHFFMFNECLNCGTHNAPSAKTCRKCDAVLKDPNAALKNKAYSDADYKKVLEMNFGMTQGGGISVEYKLDSKVQNMGIEVQEVAKEYFDPFFVGGQKWKLAKWHQFIDEHVASDTWKKAMRSCKSYDEFKQNIPCIRQPLYITHRKGDKGFSIINRKKFEEIE
jgi:superfamily II DNA or RNA helicase